MQPKRLPNWDVSSEALFDLRAYPELAGRFGRTLMRVDRYVQSRLTPEYEVSDALTAWVQDPVNATMVLRATVWMNKEIDDANAIDRGRVKDHAPHDGQTQGGEWQGYLRRFKNRQRKRALYLGQVRLLQEEVITSLTTQGISRWDLGQLMRYLMTMLLMSQREEHEAVNGLIYTLMVRIEKELAAGPEPVDPALIDPAETPSQVAPVPSLAALFSNPENQF